MGRIGDLFKKKQQRVLNVYCTAGFPASDSTIPVLEALQRHGADIVELGMPYSDPLADGPVIQQSSQASLQQGMTISRLFDQLRDMRKTIQLPVVLMGYMNPVLQYGFEKFCMHAAASGVDGLIIPDLPVYEFTSVYQEIIKRHGLDFIFLVTPETPVERVRELDSLSTGFLYAVSSSSTTGNAKAAAPAKDYLKRLQDLSLVNPVLVGFGIKDKASFDAACENANGAIIGTAYINAIGQSVDLEKDTASFLAGILR